MVKKNIWGTGQKAENLITLSKRFPDLVPRFEIVRFDDLFTNWDDVEAKLNVTATKRLRNKLTPKSYEKEIVNLINSLIINNTHVLSLNKKLTRLGFKKVSYRTSASNEDLASSSFAGQYITFLDEEIDEKTIKDKSIACLKSLFSERVNGYMRNLGFRIYQQEGSVIVQEMFYGKAAGVIFTENGSNQISVSYTNTWRNTTVEGSLTNNFIINKNPNDFFDEIPDDLPKNIGIVIKTALILEEQENKPLDIEWSVNDYDAALLQFRPVTVGSLDYSIEWDNTNIAESYPGITLPLTYTFIRKLYSKVYPEFLKLLGKSESELAGKTDIFDNMLGYINGRVYYNINNWYKLVALLPGYKYNKDFFEAMLLPAKKNTNQTKEKNRTSFYAKANVIITAIRFAILLLKTDQLSVKFTKKYLESFNKYKSVRWNSLTTIEILNTYSAIEKDLLRQWAIPILNDFRTMVFHGILKKVFFPKENDNSYIRLLAGIYDHTSVEPIRELGVLASGVKELLDKVGSNRKKAVKLISNDKKYEKIRHQIELYLAKYGGRSPDELKLENPRLSESFSDFVGFVVSTAKGYSKNNKFTKRKKVDLQSYSFGNSILKRLLMKAAFNFVLFRTKSGISKRERFRFYRAQVFGIARDVYLELGNRFVDTGLIRTRDDIFYLTTNEIHDVILGHSYDNAFISKIDERKRMFKNFEKLNIGRRIISSGVVAPINTASDPSVNKLAKGKLTGMGVSKGIFEGEVVVLHEFDPNANVKGKILVTEHADPGWTLLFLNASALIIERGNALSHASIIAREIGIPAVVAVDQACSKLTNKKRVIVNGNNGEIIIK